MNNWEKAYKMIDTLFVYSYSVRVLCAWPFWAICKSEDYIRFECSEEEGMMRILLAAVLEFGWISLLVWVAIQLDNATLGAILE